MSREEIGGGLYTNGAFAIGVPNYTIQHPIPLSYPYHPRAWGALDLWECGTEEVNIGGRKSTVTCNQAKARKRGTKSVPDEARAACAA